jgi:hypothetical protein
MEIVAIAVDPVIAKRLAQAIESVLKDQEKGDVLGALMLNLTSLACSHCCDPDEAEFFVRVFAEQAIQFARLNVAQLSRRLN